MADPTSIKDAVSSLSQDEIKQMTGQYGGKYPDPNTYFFTRMCYQIVSILASKRAKHDLKYTSFDRNAVYEYIIMFFYVGKIKSKCSKYSFTPDCV